jgi:putative SOS response-associated peptidase YedK
MCGRCSLTTPEDHLVEVFYVPPVTFDYRARYNIVPSQYVPVVASDRLGTRLGLLRRGLVPAWADSPATGSRSINARAESLLDKPSFKEAAVARRCLVPADLFYEWAKEGGGKVPYWIHFPDREPMGLAWIWERWHGGGLEPVYSMAIITVNANEGIRHLHHRMPAIVPAADRKAWLDTQTPIADALSLLKPYEGALEAYPVSTLVNWPANDVPACIERASEDERASKE